MPGDGFALPVRVGGQIDEVGVLGPIPEILDDLVLAGDGDIGGLEIVIHIDAQLLFGEIPEMPHGRLDLIAGAQIFGDGLRLGGRFHDE